MTWRPRRDSDLKLQHVCLVCRWLSKYLPSLEDGDRVHANLKMRQFANLTGSAGWLVWRIVRRQDLSSLTTATVVRSVTGNLKLLPLFWESIFLDLVPLCHK